MNPPPGDRAHLAPAPLVGLWWMGAVVLAMICSLAARQSLWLLLVFAPLAALFGLCAIGATYAHIKARTEETP